MSAIPTGGRKCARRMCFGLKTLEPIASDKTREAHAISIGDARLEMMGNPQTHEECIYEHYQRHRIRHDYGDRHRRH